jgi:hypothetical protein
MATTDAAEQLLLAIRAYRKAVMEADTNSVAHAWSKVFECDPNDTITLYLKLAGLLELSRDIEDSVNQVKGIRHSKYLSCFKKMRIGLTPRSLNSSKESDTFDAEMESRLEFCSDLLMKETVLEQPKLDEVKANVDKLFEDIEKADISPSLKKVLLQLAEQMRRSIADYKLFGVKAMKEAYGRFLVESFVHQDEIKAIKDEPLRERLREVWQSYSEAISSAANMTTLIAFSPRATEIVYNTFPFLQ